MGDFSSNRNTCRGPGGVGRGLCAGTVCCGLPWPTVAALASRGLPDWTIYLYIFQRIIYMNIVACAIIPLLRLYKTDASPMGKNKTLTLPDTNRNRQSFAGKCMGRPSNGMVKRRFGFIVSFLVKVILSMLTHRWLLC